MDAFENVGCEAYAGIGKKEGFWKMLGGKISPWIVKYRALRYREFL
jgi:hypothetical protein